MSDTTYVEQIWDFLELGRRQLTALAEAMATGDTVLVRSCTQDLLVRASGLGLREVAKCAEKVEMGAYNCCMTHTLTSYSCLRSKLEELKKELARVPEAG